jgi:MFS transporter, ACS family, hexuronate transporter
MNLSPRLLGYRRIRWVIVGLLFCCGTLNYIDRQTLSILAPTLRHEFSLSERDYANIVTAFLVSYTVMYPLVGRFIDWAGVRLGLAASIVWWSIATMLTAVARGGPSLLLFRFLLGIGEPANGPAGYKATGEWFPIRERAFPGGVIISGSAVGATIAPPLIGWVAISYGWRAAFLLPGAAGILWVVVWLLVYKSPDKHPSVTSADLALLQDDVPNLATVVKQESWLSLLKQRRTWAMALPKLVCDPIWYFYVFWLPDYLQRGRGFTLRDVAMYGWIPFLAADLGAVVGGAASDWLIRHGTHPVRARMTVILGASCIAPVGVFTGFVDSPGMVLVVATMAIMLVPCWNTNSFTLATEIFSSSRVGSVIGIMGAAGTIGAILFSQLLPFVIVKFTYPAAFMFAALLMPLATAIMILLLRPWEYPRLGQVAEVPA